MAAYESHNDHDDYSSSSDSLDSNSSESGGDDYSNAGSGASSEDEYDSQRPSTWVHRPSKIVQKNVERVHRAFSYYSLDHGY